MNFNKALKVLNDIAREELEPKIPTFICESGRHFGTPSKNVHIKVGDKCCQDSVHGDNHWVKNIHKLSLGGGI